MDEFTKQKVTELKKAVKTLQDQARNVKKNDNTHGLIEVTHPEQLQPCLRSAAEAGFSTRRELNEAVALIVYHVAPSAES